MKLDFRQRLLTTTLLVGVAALANPAYAQETQSTVPDENQATNPGGAPPAGPVESQPTPTVSAEGEAVEQASDIIVTGTRIPSPNLESAAPVTVVTNQDIKLTGSTRVDEVLNQLPSATTPQGPGLPNAASGTAEVDLRYLGAKRTLSLVNGRRLSPGNPGQGSSQAGDINMIPASMVKRIEVLTGGASSVYGADAVAGVVNFIMDTDFSGLRLDGQISTYQHNNDCPSIGGGATICDELDRQINVLNRVGYEYPSGSTWDGKGIDATISFGAGFDDGRGHVMGYFGYRKQDEIYNSDRDYSVCSLNVGGPLGEDPQGVSCGGSSFSAEGNFLLFDEGTSTFFTRGPNGTLLGGRTRYNYAPLNHWLRPDEKYVAGVFANYEITPAIKPYLEFMFLDDKTEAQIAPSGNFANTYSINCDNPFMSDQARGIICDGENLVNGFVGNFPLTPISNADNPEAPPLTFFDSAGNQYQQGFFQIFKRNVEGGPRIAKLKHSSYRAVIGTRGDLTNAFSYDAYYQYGRTNYTQVYENEFSAQRLARSLNVVNVDENNNVLDENGDLFPIGTPGTRLICRSVLDNSDPNCIPYNYFGTPSQEAVSYLNVYGEQQGETSEQVANVNVTGALGELGVQTPWSDLGVGVNVGWEYRKESLELNPDALFQLGDLTGQGAPTLPNQGSFKVNEIFAETQIPIVRNDFIHELSIGAGYRKSWYKLENGRKYDTDTYKISAEFAPIADIRFRGSYNRAVRAPNIVELFSSQYVALDGSTDPCSADSRVAIGLPAQIGPTDYGCLAQGMVVGQKTPTNPSEQYNGLLGGNPDLVPEKATTKTLGVVLQPRFLPRFALTIDYWNIKLEKAIQGYGADTLLADCVSNATASFTPFSCGLINRDVSGSIWLTPSGYVEDLPNNVGRIKTDGFDFNAAYSHRLGGMGNLSFSFLGTLLRHYKVLNGIAPEYDCAGYYGSVCSGAAVASASVMPKWRHKFRTTWQSPFGLGLTVGWRRVGKAKFEVLSDDVALTAGPTYVHQLNDRVKAQDYIDLAATYTLFDMVNLRGGINNIFDKTPPIIPVGLGSCPAASCNTGNTYPGTWDYLGRYLYLGATIDFKHKPTPVVLPAPVLPPPPPPAAPATITCPDGLVILADQQCPAPPPPPPPPPPAPERGN